MISTHPSPPPPRSIPYLLSVSLSLSLAILPREKSREGQRWKEGEEIQSGASQGGPIERIRQGRRVRGTEQRDNSQGQRERKSQMFNLQSFLLQTDLWGWRKTNIRREADRRTDVETNMHMDRHAERQPNTQTDKLKIERLSNISFSLTAAIEPLFFLPSGVTPKTWTSHSPLPSIYLLSFVSTFFP